MNTQSERDTNTLPYLSALPEAIAATRKQVQADLQALADVAGNTPLVVQSALLPIGMGAGIELLVVHDLDRQLRYATPLATPECVEAMRKCIEPRDESFVPADAAVRMQIQVLPVRKGMRRGMEVAGTKNRIGVSEGHGLTQALALAWDVLAAWPEATDFNAVVAPDDEGVEGAEKWVMVYLDGEEENGDLVFTKNHMAVRAEFANAALAYLEHLLRQDARCIGYTDIYRDCATDEERETALMPMIEAEDALMVAMFPVEDDTSRL